MRTSKLDEPKYALHSCPVRISRSMEVLAHFVDRKGYIRTSEGKILKPSNYTAVTSSFISSKKGSLMSGKPVSHSHGSGSRSTLKHPSTLKEVNGILLLGKNQTRRLMVYLNTEEIMKSTKVLDSKCSSHSSNQPLSS
jgi:hypothetical protein